MKNVLVVALIVVFVAVLFCSCDPAPKTYLDIRLPGGANISVEDKARNVIFSGLVSDGSTSIKVPIEGWYYIYAQDMYGNRGKEAYGVVYCVSGQHTLWAHNW